MAATKITAAEALKFFKGGEVTVRITRAVKVKGEDGVERMVNEPKKVPLSEAGILSAADHGDKVVIVTIDGKRHEAPKK